MSRLKIIALLCWSSLAVPALGAEHPIALAIHGGAGVIERAKMTPEREASYRAGLEAALNAGYAILDARYVNTVGALAWWLFARRLNQIPTQTWTVRLYDGLIVPPLRRIESGLVPRFGQSLLCVGRRSTEL